MTEPGHWTLVSTDRLNVGQQHAILDLDATVAALDGAAPLNEDAVLQLPSVAPERHHRIVSPAEELLGYAQLRRSLGEPSTAEIAVGPGHRGEVSAALFAAVESSATDDLLVWSHGDASPVKETAGLRGYHEDRVLLAMSRPTAASDAETPASPAGVLMRTFFPGVDDRAWLAVNHRAFADHPEQGRWGPDELAARLASPWFDPAGFFLAVDAAGTVLGFHWTKLHQPAVPDDAPVGEVYVLGVDPAAQGRGLGGLLLRVGLAHLARRGVSRVILYSDEANHGAVALYRRAGFGVVRREVRFRRSR